MLTIACDNVFASRLCLLEAVPQEGEQLRKEGNLSKSRIRMMLSLAGVDRESIVFPIDIAPFQSKDLGGATQTTVATQRED